MSSSTKKKVATLFAKLCDLPYTIDEYAVTVFDCCTHLAVAAFVATNDKEWAAEYNREAVCYSDYLFDVCYTS